MRDNNINSIDINVVNNKNRRKYRKPAIEDVEDVEYKKEQPVRAKVVSEVKSNYKGNMIKRKTHQFLLGCPSLKTIKVFLIIALLTFVTMFVVTNKNNLLGRNFNNPLMNKINSVIGIFKKDQKVKETKDANFMAAHLFDADKKEGTPYGDHSIQRIIDQTLQTSDYKNQIKVSNTVSMNFIVDCNKKYANTYKSDEDTIKINRFGFILIITGNNKNDLEYIKNNEEKIKDIIEKDMLKRTTSPYKDYKGFSSDVISKINKSLNKNYKINVYAVITT